MDICIGTNCSLREKCRRYKNNESSMQIYLPDVPVKKINGIEVCDMFMQKPISNGKKILSILLFILSLCSSSVDAQNYVTNGSFESVIGVDTSAAGINDTSTAFIMGAGCFSYYDTSYAAGWRTLVLTPDRLVYGTICPPYDNDMAASGKAYLVLGNSESVIGNLTIALETGFTYKLSFSYQRETMYGNAGPISRIGFFCQPAGNIILSPLIVDALTWQRYEYLFTASFNSTALEIRGMISGAGTKIDSIVLEPYNPLPVQLLSFTGEVKEGEVLLQWVTASEINNDCFSVQRSIDGKVFTEIGRVFGAGNSSAKLYYEFPDYKPIHGVSYYRLVSIDYDGKKHCSDIITNDSFINEGNKFYGWRFYKRILGQEIK